MTRVRHKKCRYVLWNSIILFYPPLSWAQPCQPYLTRPGGILFDGDAMSLATFDAGDGEKLYFSGALGIPPQAPSPTQALLRFDGSSWTTLQGGPNHFGGVFKILDFGGGPQLYGQWFDNGTPGVQFVGRWTGSAWVNAPPQVREAVVSVDETTGPITYGLYTDTITGRMGVHRWTGNAWHQLGTANTFSGLRHLIPYLDGAHEHLFVAGSFTQIGDVSVWGIARLNGNAWEPLDNGSLSLGVDAWCVGDVGFGQELFIAGHMAPAGTPTPFPPGIAAWNGQSWRQIPLSLNGPPQTSISMSALAVFDDGSGPALYLAGGFTSVSGVPARNIAKYNGKSWRSVGAGIGTYVHHLASYNDRRGPSLFMAGSFATVGSAGANIFSVAIAQYVGCPGPAYSDCDLYGGRNPQDFICFINKYAGRDPHADCNVDGLLNAHDFSCFIQKYAQP